MPLTLNVVLHRDNLDHVAELDRARRVARRGSPRARQHAVPRLGAGEPEGAACPRASSSSAPARSPARLGSASGAAWRCCSSRPTTTPSSRRPAWTAGRGDSCWSRPTASLSPATPRTRIPGLHWERVTRAAAAGRSGGSRRASTRSAGRRGCRSRAGAATGATWTSAAAAARRTSSRATRPAPTPSARSPRITTSSRPRRGEQGQPAELHLPRAARGDASAPLSVGPAAPLRRPLDPADHAALRVVAQHREREADSGSTPRPRRPPSRLNCP